LSKLDSPASSNRDFTGEQLQALQALELGPVFELIRKRPSTVLLAQQAGDLSELALAVSSCQGCALCESRKQPVFGKGALQPAWMIIGGAPSAEDDFNGEPASGDNGRFLNAVLSSLGIHSEHSLYFTTAVKCMPDAQRLPLAGEWRACLPILQRQIAQVNPRALLLMGEPAARSVLGLDQRLDALRGKIHSVEIAGIQYPAVVTYAPDQVLIEPLLKAMVWRDVLLMRAAHNPSAH
jgi:uracil-DNA glycosylase